MLIELKDIHKTYNNGQPLHVLKGVDLEIGQGEFVSIMGASGSGKSTLLNILGILDNYDEGTYYLDGQLIKDLSEKEAAHYRNKMIGFVFQSFNLISFKTAVENVELPLFYQGVGRKKRRELAMEYLERFGLVDWALHYPNEMSGGQKQRVAIARALAMEPEILLFDEPTSALDPTMVSEVLGVMTRLAREGMTMIVVTHEMRFARQVSSRVLFFADGVVYEDGTPDQLFNHPQRELTRQFIRQIHESTFLIESEHFDWYAMIAQMEQFCQHYNVSRRQTESLLHVIDETMAILSSGNGVAALPGTRLTLSYAEQDDVLQFTVNSPQPVNPEMFQNGSDNIAATILRSYSSDISINGNDLRITI